MRALWLAAGAVATLVALTLSTGNLWHVLATAEPPTEHMRSSIPFTLSDLKVEAGDGVSQVAITAGRDGELLLQRTVRWSGEKPRITEHWDGRTLRLDARCPGARQPDGPICQGLWVLYVPPETRVDASARHGGLRVSSVFADVRVTSVSGNIEVTGILGSLWARSGTGNIVGMDLLGEEADVETGAGVLNVGFVNPPAKVRAVVRTVGDVTVTVPRAWYDVTAQAKERVLDVKQAGTASRKITATAPEGSVFVCCR